MSKKTKKVDISKTTRAFQQKKGNKSTKNAFLSLFWTKRKTKVVKKWFPPRLEGVMMEHVCHFF